MRVERTSLGKRRIRWAGIALGIAIFFWLPVEDDGPAVALGLAGALCALGALWSLERRASRSAVVTWGLAGLLAVPLGVGLMIFKGGLHAHSLGDISPLEARELLSWTPYGGAAGSLAGWVWSKIIGRRRDARD